MRTKENLDHLGARKVDHFVVQQKISPRDTSKLNAFDEILDICHLKYTKTIERELKNTKLDCNDCVASTFVKKWDLKKGKQLSIIRRIGQFMLIITSSRYSTGKKVENKKTWDLKKASNSKFEGKLDNLLQL